MKIRHLALPFALLTASAQPVLAQTFKAGLWETNSKAGAGSGKLQGLMAMAQQQMAAMSPEQRAKVDGMMARQGVVLNSDGVVAKMCVTPEMAKAHQLPLQQRGNCSYQTAPIQGNTVKFSFSCTNPQGAGDGTVTFSSPTAYTATTRVNTTATGESETVNIDSTGRWLGADCGSIRPLQ
ncbi:MAG: DUF3617 domain-containing protein [Pseudomonadota bacterium]|nr:DUF3617 domain-containing protein [Pseudomonadota bacterium]